ncbi:MAG: glycosyltransferase family protein [Candidatus Nanoarchaeia archaeon]
MKILYGVQATGNGHISRSREVIAQLKKQGHSVHVIFSGRYPATIFDVDIFKPFSAFKGFTFAIENGSINKFKTALSLDLIQFFKDISSFDASEFDLAIVDFEPLTSRIAKKHKIPLIGIGHQYAFKYKIPKAKCNPLDTIIMNLFAPADFNLGLHWHHFNLPLLPPIIPDIKRQNDKVIQNKIVVYLPFESPLFLKEIFAKFANYEFFIYAVSKEFVDEKNLHWRPASRKDFLNDLIEANGVITNAGFELPSEAIHLGKKLFVIPVAGQLEQESNALAIQQLKLGISERKLTCDSLRNWLENFNSNGYLYPQCAPEIAKWIESGNWHKISVLSEKLWQQTNFNP